MEYFNTFFLDKESDIRVDLYKNNNQGYLSYVISTPFVHTGNLITNLAKITNTKVSFNADKKKIIRGRIPCFLTTRNDEVYIFRLNGRKIANIYPDGTIEKRCLIPAISKVLMTQTKDYKLSVSQTLVKTYLPYGCKFKTDLHTHMNGNIYPSALVALGIKRQLRYPYYYVKKLGLKLTKAQFNELEKKRKNVAKDFKDSPLQGKKLDRAIDDNTFINFADLILNNIENADYNLNQVRNSLTILKDGQAVFTNLEKLYLYRYVFTKGTESEKLIELKNVEKIPHKDVLKRLNKMLEDTKHPIYRKNTLFEDEMLWVARQYQKQGIEYVEIADTNLVKSPEAAALELKQMHHIMPYVEEETGVRIRLLAALRRIPLTLVKTNTTPANYLRDCLDILKTVSKDPYVRGCDIVGEEINDINELRPVIKELVAIAKDDPSFTIRIHAGENDSLLDNVSNSIKCVKESLAPGQKLPIFRLGHGLAVPSLKSKAGKQLLDLIKENHVALEFQITSNVRLNNLIDITKHPFREYLKHGVHCLQGTDGCGIYGTDSMDEQLALINLLGLTEPEMRKVIKTEENIIAFTKKAFITKSESFKEFLNGRSIEKAFVAEVKKNRKNSNELVLDVTNSIDARESLKNQIKELPWDKTPIVIGGGSFNSDTRKTRMQTQSKNFINKLLNELDPEKYFFVIGHKLEGYEKYLVQNNRSFDIFAIVPGAISEEQNAKLLKSKVNIRVSTESLGMGIYKSFNYEIFERRPSVVVMMDGNSAGANLIQEAKNGKAKARIFVSNESDYLTKKAQTLEGYVTIFNPTKGIIL